MNNQTNLEERVSNFSHEQLVNTIVEQNEIILEQTKQLNDIIDMNNNNISTYQKQIEYNSKQLDQNNNNDESYKDDIIDDLKNTSNIQMILLIILIAIVAYLVYCM
tara:strand:+ start:230 stop:547 length:318 start_codon:yes stop_codon:yes gene_type:complete